MLHNICRTRFVAGLALVIAALPARAQEVVSDPGSYSVIGTLQGAVTGAIQSMMSGIVSSVTGLQTSLNTVLTQGFTQNANYAKAQISAHQQIADASNEANAEFLRNIRNAQIRDQHVLHPQHCVAMSNLKSMTAASVQAAKVSTAIAQVMDPRAQARPNTPAWDGQAKRRRASALPPPPTRSTRIRRRPACSVRRTMPIRTPSTPPMTTRPNSSSRSCRRQSAATPSRMSPVRTPKPGGAAIMPRCRLPAGCSTTSSHPAPAPLP